MALLVGGLFDGISGFTCGADVFEIPTVDDNGLKWHQYLATDVERSEFRFHGIRDGHADEVDD